ncbi:MAG: helix-turn-helix transcriptional regulator [Clostridia bacterium]|nr:helix-turn-helix transcriptional regulator [Clostridia bacterium]
MLALNENIKKLRIVRGLNQVEFAKILCVTKQCVSNWENDNVVPSIDMLCKIADFFEVSTDYLLGRSERRVIEVSSLTDEQIAHITSLIYDLTKLNRMKER